MTTGNSSIDTATIFNQTAANDDKAGGMRNKHQSIEEPCAEKSASTVLKTSRSGDGAA